MQDNRKKQRKDKFATARARKIIVSADLFNTFEANNNENRWSPSESSTSSPSNISIQRHNSSSSDSSGRSIEIDDKKDLDPKKLSKFLNKVLFKDGKQKNVSTVGDVIADKTDSKSKEGEPLNSNVVVTEISTSLVSNKNTSLVQTSPTGNNRVIVIKNLAGKSISIIPKKTPVFLNKEDHIYQSEISKPTVVKLTKIKTDNSVVVKKRKKRMVPQKICDPEVRRDAKTEAPKQYENKHKKELKKIYIAQPVSLKQILPDNPRQPTQSEEKTMNINKAVPNFSKILHVLTNSSLDQSSIPRSDVTQDIRIPIYVDRETQTEQLAVCKEVSTQTEVSMPSSQPTAEELPNITSLLEYIFKTPDYSMGLDEMKKNNLIDMSRNIAMKGKSQETHPQGEEGLKRKLFLDLKNCVNFDFLGNNPIHNAVLENNLNVLRQKIFALRLRKFSIDIENYHGQTALQMAVINNSNMEIITTLLLNRADVTTLDNEGNNLLHLAVMNSSHIVLEQLIKFLCDPIKEINRKNDKGLTPLMIAAIDSKPEMVDTLLTNHADPNLRDEKSGRTALFHAVELNSNAVISILLKYKADPRIRNFFGLTALDAATDLDLPDVNMLQTERETPEPPTSVLLQKRKLAPSDPNPKKSKLKFAPSFKQVQLQNVQTTSATGRKRKK